MRRVTCVLAWVWIVGAGVASTGCARVDRGGAERRVVPAAQRPADSAVRRGLLWLEATQSDGEDEHDDPWTWSGVWPERIAVRGGSLVPPVRERSAGITAFVHHALTHVDAQALQVHGLEREDLERALRMRRRAAAYLGRFGVRHADLPPSLYGWWPPAATSPTGVAAAFLAAHVGGPRQRGILQPPGIAAFPAVLRVWPDVDDTALVRAVLAEEELDSSAPARGWALRDRATGAWLTWRPPDRLAQTIRNDVDLAVNANVLFWLARTRVADAPGRSDSIALLRRAVAEAPTLEALPCGAYYPDATLVAYTIVRAAREGPVPELGPAAERLARLVAHAGRPDGRGGLRWGTGHQAALETACALYVLASSPGHPDAVRAAARALESMQHPRTGAWPEAVVCLGRTESGVVLEWRSAALPTALAIEALIVARRPVSPPGGARAMGTMPQ